MRQYTETADESRLQFIETGLLGVLADALTFPHAVVCNSGCLKKIITDVLSNFGYELDY